MKPKGKRHHAVGAKTRDRETLAQRCQTLQKERRRLQQQVQLLTAERDQFKKSLFALMHEDIPINKRELLALVGKQRPLRDVIGDLKKLGA
jgi:seryl-tRNA synthetase